MQVGVLDEAFSGPTAVGERGRIPEPGLDCAATALSPLRCCSCDAAVTCAGWAAAMEVPGLRESGASSSATHVFINATAVWLGLPAGKCVCAACDGVLSAACASGPGPGGRRCRCD
jgi:hypothetical protein